MTAVGSASTAAKRHLLLCVQVNCVEVLVFSDALHILLCTPSYVVTAQALHNSWHWATLAALAPAHMQQSLWHSGVNEKRNKFSKFTNQCFPGHRTVVLCPGPRSHPCVVRALTQVHFATVCPIWHNMPDIAPSLELALVVSQVVQTHCFHLALHDK